MVGGYPSISPDGRIRPTAFGGDLVRGPRGLRQAGDRREEFLLVERPDGPVGDRAHGRRARHVVQQRDLAEIAALVGGVDPRAVAHDLEGARVHDIEPVTHVALADQLGAGGGLDQIELAPDPLEVDVRQAARTSGWR